MISQISGKVVDLNEHSVTVQVSDIAYEILVPGSVIQFYRKQRKNSQEDTKVAPPDTVSFYTIQYIEGTSSHGNQFMRMVGFKRKIEKDFFQLYTSVEGIGYKTALKSLVLPMQKIALAIEENDILTLKKLPHIGARTAEKMVATLRGRMKKFTLDQADQPLSVTADSDLQSEVSQVLQQVGYARSEAEDLIGEVLGKNPKIQSSEEMIQEIFRLKNQS
ncbi:MAG: hypothetical protein HY610_01480 [Elusimicrobia bacterium]|nr:hypothetical protein [Elusimicrobiota bacterium]